MERKYNELELNRREKLQKLIELGIKPYQNINHYDDNSQTLVQKYAKFSKETLFSMQQNSSIVGRIITFRDPFIVIKDEQGKAQVYINSKNKDLKKIIKLCDIGDILFFKGVVMKTNIGEICLNVQEIKMLTKSLKPWPNKFSGLSEVEERLRHRYVDLAINDEVKQVFWIRTKIIKLIRQYFDSHDYMEVETPILHDVLGGAAAKPFTTHHNTLKKDFYLRIATELPLKKLLVGNINRVYEIGRLFRNEGIDTTHNPEFTTIEFYQGYANLQTMMDHTEALFAFIAKGLNIKDLIYQGQKIDLTKPFKRLDMIKTVSEIVNYDFNVKPSTSLQNNKLSQEVLAIAKKHDIKVETFFTTGHIINALFEKYIEKTLIDPTFVTNYPIEISPLAAKNVHDERFTDRAELFINGREYANMFTELNDPIDQLSRFQNQLKERELGNDEASEIDWDFVEALEYGMPPAGGCGIGIDRLVMLFTNQVTIREVLLFPHLRSLNENEKINNENEECEHDE